MNLIKLIISIFSVIAIGCNKNPKTIEIKNKRLYSVGSISGSEIGEDNYLKIIKMEDSGQFDFNEINLNNSTKYRVKIIGNKVSIDANSPLWKMLTNSRITIVELEADEIEVNGQILLFQTSLVLRSHKILVKENSFIAVTPKPIVATSDFDTPSERSGKNGRQGYKGGSIVIDSEELKIEGDLEIPRFIANGGDGQRAGNGRNGLNGANSILFDPRQRIYEFFLVGLQPPDVARYAYIRDHLLGREYLDYVGSIDITFPAIGTTVFPTDGGPAVPAGYPGAGGNGGQVSIFTKKLNITEAQLGQLISVKPGNNGTAGPLRYEGGTPGEPNSSLVLRAKNSGTPSAHFEVDERVTRPGPFALSPQAPENSNTLNVKTGAFSISIGESYEGPIFSESYFENRLSYIRDLYLGNQKEEVLSAINADLNFINSMDEKSPLAKFESMIPILLKMQSLKNQLLQNKNYFGELETQAPRFPFPTTVDYYKAELDRYIRVSSLSHYLNFVQADRALKQKALSELISNLKVKSNIELQKLLSANHEINKLSDLTKELDRQNNILLEQKSQIQNQIENDAKENIISKETAAQALSDLRKMVEIAKFFPVGQPYVGVIGTLYGQMLAKQEGESLSSSSDGEIIAESWMNVLDPEALRKGNQEAQNFVKIIEDLKASPPDIQSDDLTEDEINSLPFKSNELVQEAKNKKKAENLKARDDYSNMKKEASRKLLDITFNLNKKYQSINKKIESLRAPKDDLQKEMELLSSKNPTFQKIKLTVEEIQKLQIETSDKLNAQLRLIIEVTDSLEVSKKLFSESLDQLLDNVGNLDPKMVSLISNLEYQMGDKLLGLYSEACKAFTYINLSPPSHVIKLSFFLNNIKSFPKANISKEELNQKIADLYLVALDNLIVELGEKVKLTHGKYDLFTDYTDLDLSESTLLDLNQLGQSVITLNDEMFGGDKINVKIRKIEVLKPSLIGEPTKVDLTGKGLKVSPWLDWTVQLGNWASFVDLETNKKIKFTYDGMESIFRWKAMTYVHGNEDVAHQVSGHDSGFPSIMSVLVGAKYPDLKRTNFVIDHGGNTDHYQIAKIN